MSATRQTLARRALSCLDLTDLSDDHAAAEAEAVTSRARTAFGPVAAVCLWPEFVAMAARQLQGSGIRVATVVNFPDGGEEIGRTTRQTRQAVRDGADEIDLVIPWRALQQGRDETVRDMISAVRQEIPVGLRLKTILETGELADPAAISRASDIAIAAGADFLKTSTGKTKISATPQAARIMLARIAASGRTVGFKASGGVRTLDDAAVYLDLADEIFGLGNVGPHNFRFGASGLLNALLSELAAAA